MGIWKGGKMEIIEWLLDLLFPPKCPFCHRVIDRREELFCEDCQRELPWALGRQGEQKPEFTAGCLSPLFYQERTREAVHRYKFQNCPSYSKAFGTLMAQEVEDLWPQRSFDCVTWVPLSEKRLRKRGYDQARLLAEEVGRQLDLPVERTLEKTRHTPAQSGQEGESQRRANVLDAYSMAEGVQVEGKTLLLVDDVVTTGSTLSECARILRTFGAMEVWCLTLARTGKK